VKSFQDKAVDPKDASICPVVLLQVRFVATVRLEISHQIQPIVDLPRSPDDLFFEGSKSCKVSLPTQLDLLPRTTSLGLEV